MEQGWGLESRTVSAEVRPSGTWRNYTVTFKTQALPGTLAALAGTLTAARLDIGSAMITLSDSMVIDTFDVTALPGAAIASEDGPRLAGLASDVLNRRRDIGRELDELRREFPSSNRMPPRVEIRPDSLLTTGISVVCADRPGLLYDITSRLTAHRLRVRSLSVLTFGGKAHDMFRVVDADGRPPVHEHLLAAAREDLLHVCS